jgi:proline iminopeptidase
MAGACPVCAKGDLRVSYQYPTIDPYDSGMLDVGDGHHVYWECCGNPDGKPALFLHGGPGTGSSPGQRRLFNPELYRAVLFDQRGSGRSTPLASEPDADLSINTTHHLVVDIEALREHLGIEKWVVLGMSWGSTLGLAYAQTHPQRVSTLILALVTTTSRREVEWITEDVGRIFPCEWDRFAAAVPERLRHMRLVDAYATMLFDPDPAVREHAALEWCTWEDAHVSLVPGYQPSLRYEDPEFRLRFAQLVTHYWRHHAFLEEDQLLRDAATLNGIPGVLIHGRYDVSGPLITAWRLSQRWTSSQLHVIDEAGHGGDSIGSAVVDALNRIAVS